MLFLSLFRHCILSVKFVCSVTFYVYFEIDIKINLGNTNTYNAWEGRLDISMEGKHGTVAVSHFTQNMADRFCKYVGYNERFDSTCMMLFYN